MRSRTTLIGPSSLHTSIGRGTRHTPVTRKPTRRQRSSMALSSRDAPTQMASPTSSSCNCPRARSRVREARRAGKMVRRVENAREGAIDYRLGMGPEESQLVEHGDGEEEGQTFRGNRQIRGSSVLGAQRGGASGLKAWAGLVEDRIQRARGKRTAWVQGASSANAEKKRASSRSQMGRASQYLGIRTRGILI
jgi:hypothetical protein